mgnify:CR=1 FL=1
MLKIGEVRLLGYDEPMMLAWYSNDAGEERLDVYTVEDAENMNYLDTSDCVASSIVGRDNRIYGDKAVITRIKQAKREASLLCVPEEKEVTIINGQFQVTIKKSNPDIGVYYELRMVNGKTAYEMYKLDHVVVEIDKFFVCAKRSSACRQTKNERFLCCRFEIIDLLCYIRCSPA